MTAGLVTRMVPLAAADGARLKEAAALRGPAAEPVGRAALARRLVEGSLDRAVDVAAALRAAEATAAGARTQARREPSRDDAPLILTGAVIVLAGVVARIAGAGGIETYPRMPCSTWFRLVSCCRSPCCNSGQNRRTA